MPAGVGVVPPVSEPEVALFGASVSWAPSGAGLRPLPLFAACLGSGSPLVDDAFSLVWAGRSKRLVWVFRFVVVFFAPPRVRLGAGVFGRCSRFSTSLTSGMSRTDFSIESICFWF